MSSKPADKDDSESSSIDDDDIRDLIKETGIPANLVEDVKSKLENNQVPTSIPFGSLVEKKEKEFLPYTFDPSSVLRGDAETAHKNDELIKDPLYELSQSPPKMEKASPTATKAPYAQYKPVSVPSYSAREKESGMSGSYKAYIPPTATTSKYTTTPTPPSYGGISALNMSMTVEDPTVARGTQDYKDFAKDFEKEFGSIKTGQSEIDAMTKRVEIRYKSLQEFSRELERADVDMLLFKNKLMREISDIQNDLREANSNVLVLMKDRANMKDQFCLMQVRIKKLRGVNKTFQEDMQAYHFHFHLRIDEIWNSGNFIIHATKSRKKTKD